MLEKRKTNLNSFSNNVYTNWIIIKMMKDNLEKFIKENRSSFDKDIPSLKVWAEIDKNLSSPKSKPRNIWGFAKIAASVLILLFAGAAGGEYFTKSPDDTAAIIARVNPDFADMSQYYAQEVSLKLNELKQYNYEPFIEDDIKELDVFLEELKTELKNAPRGSEESIINAMIKNQQTKLSILEQILKLQSINQAQNSNNNETIDI